MFLKQIYSNCLRINLHRQIWKFYSTKKSVILGIETSCDDTGCAIIDSDGNILGEALNSQQEIHTKYVMRQQKGIAKLSFIHFSYYF